jgi:D-lactate dehydrogenase
LRRSDAFDIAEKYGKDTFLAIQYLGTNRLPLMFSLKGSFDAFCARFKFLPHDLSDRMMQFFSSLFPRHLPKKLYDYRNRFEHHLMLRMADDGIDEARAHLHTVFPSAEGPISSVRQKTVRKPSYIGLRQQAPQSVTGRSIDGTSRTS